MAKYTFFRKVKRVWLRRKLKKLFLILAFGIGTLIFLFIQMAFLTNMRNERSVEPQVYDEPFLTKHNKGATTPHRLQPDRLGTKDKLAPSPKHSSDTHLPPYLPTSTPSGEFRVYNQTKNPSFTFGPFIDLQLFPDLLITAAPGSERNSGQQPVHEEDQANTEPGPSELICGTDPFLPSAPKHLTPLRNVRIQLLRQRVNRRCWSNFSSSTTSGSSAMEQQPVVSLTPLESSFHHFPDELLVEEYLSGGVGKGSHMDPKYILPIGVTAAPLRGFNCSKAKPTEEKRGDETQSSAGDVSNTLLLFRQNKPSKDLGGCARSVIEAVPARKGKLSPSQLRWCPDSSCERMAIEVLLFKLKPPLASASDPFQQPEDLTRTEASAASFIIPRVTKLYGLPRYERSLKDTSNMRLSVRIPLDGFRYLASIKGNYESDASSETGVLPLVFVELDRVSSSSNAPAPRGAEPLVVGILWFNGAPFFASTETLSSANRAASSSSDANRSFIVRLNFTSSAAVTRVFLLPGPTMAEVLKQYYTLTGFPTLPPLMALGYHYHTRVPLNYNAGQFAGAVNSAFWNARIPLDSLGLTSSTINQYGTPFTWNSNISKDVMGMQVKLWCHGRRSLIVRVIPAIPIVHSSPLYHEGRKGGHFISSKPGDDTWWMGYTKDRQRSHIIDFVRSASREWFSKMFAYKRFTHSTNFTFIALQQAAPDLLGTENSTLPMDVGHTGGFAHRQVHNVFNTYVAMAVQEGLLRRNLHHRRAFITSENYFIGIHRFSGVFLQRPFFSEESETESDLGNAKLAPPPKVAQSRYSRMAWQQLRDSIYSCAHLGLMGVPFVGVNIAPGNSESRIVWSKLPQQEREELLTRWYQAASLFPLMRAEEMIEESAKDDTSAVVSNLPKAMLYQGVRDAVRLRYALLPYLYTSMWRLSEQGGPIPLAPIDQSSGDRLDENESYAVCVSIGRDLVACPYVKMFSSWEPQVKHVKVRLPRNLQETGYNNYWTGEWWEVDAKMPRPREVVKVEKMWLGQVGWVESLKMESADRSFLSDIPLFQRTGSIVPTFLALNGQMASTRFPSNFSLTIALPKMLRALWQESLEDEAKQVLLATGEVFWDDGTTNTQIPSPALPTQLKQKQASRLQPGHCHVRLECYVKGDRLMLSGTQLSPSCVESLNALASTWNHPPPQMDALLRAAEELEEVTRHGEEVNCDAEEDQGLDRRKRGLHHDSTQSSTKSMAHKTTHILNTTIEDKLDTSFCLKYVRFLVASSEDFVWLSKKLKSAIKPTKSPNRLDLVIDLETPVIEGNNGITPVKDESCSLFGVKRGPIDVTKLDRHSGHTSKTTPWIISF